MAIKNVSKLNEICHQRTKAIGKYLNMQFQKGHISHILTNTLFKDELPVFDSLPNR